MPVTNSNSGREVDGVRTKHVPAKKKVDLSKLDHVIIAFKSLSTLWGRGLRLNISLIWSLQGYFGARKARVVPSRSRFVFCGYK